MGFGRRLKGFGVVLLLSWACTAGADAALLSAEQLSTALPHKDFLLVDVRTPQEQAAGVIPGTDFLMPHDRIASDWKGKAIPLDQPIVLYCHSGRRSARAVQTLRALGYTNVRDLSGGLSAWQDAGLPVIKP